jgi:hypothetical protein
VANEFRCRFVRPRDITYGELYLLTNTVFPTRNNNVPVISPCKFTPPARNVIHHDSLSCLSNYSVVQQAVVKVLTVLLYCM